MGTTEYRLTQGCVTLSLTQQEINQGGTKQALQIRELIQLQRNESWYNCWQSYHCVQDPHHVTYAYQAHCNSVD